MPAVPLFVHLLVGAGLLLAGRKLFWLFVGGIGFLAGFTLGQEYFPAETETMHLVLAVGMGLGGALLAYVAQKVALSVGGFLAGGFLGVTLVRDLLGTAGPVPAALFLVAGVAGLVLVHLVFDWAVTLLSAFAGAYVISQLLPMGETAQLVVVVALSAIGVAVQKGMFEPKERKGPPKASAEELHPPKGDERPPEKSKGE